MENSKMNGSGKIKKTREMDQNFREQLKNDRIYTCEKHFAPEDIEICKYIFSFDCAIFIYVFRIFLDQCFNLLSEVHSESEHSFCLTISKCDNFIFLS